MLWLKPNFLAALLAFTPLGFAGTDRPATMTKIVVRLTGPAVRERSFAARAKTIYVASPHYARIEDPPDPRQHTQRLTIIAEPDAYSVNLIQKTGTHAADQGGAGDLHLPIILPFDPNHRFPALDTLEFGDEVPFFKASGARKTRGPMIGSKNADVYQLSGRGGNATLVTRADSNRPLSLSWQTKSGTYKYEYLVYQQLPFQPALFTRPTGIQYKESLPDTTKDYD
jgi:hypothetical protein